MEKNIIWLDKNVNNHENKKTLEILKRELNNYNFYTFTSVPSVFKEIKTNEKFWLKLFYVIVSGSQADEFFTQYVKASHDYPILAATIVYCYNRELYEQKPFFSDPFLNPGGIVTSYKGIIDYIQKDECDWTTKGNTNSSPKSTELQDSSKNITEEKYTPNLGDFGNSFKSINSLPEIAYPIYIQKFINSSTIKDEDADAMQDFLLKHYSEYKDLIKPSQEKNILVPYHILAKFLLKMYTEEKPPFYKNMNIDLSNDNFDIYRTYIFLMFNALNKKTIKSYNKRLYRYGYLKPGEFSNLKKLYDSVQRKKKEEEKKEKGKKNLNDEKNFNIVSVFSKPFLSFSKDEKTIKRFLKFNEDLITVKYIIEPNKVEDFTATNIDIEEFSIFKEEKEVLILPLTCFEIKSMTSTMFKNNPLVEIHLSYLSPYKSQIDEILQKINEQEIQTFFTKVLNSDYGKEVQKLFGQEMHENLKKYFEQVTSLKINVDYKWNNYIKQKPKI